MSIKTQLAAVDLIFDVTHDIVVLKVLAKLNGLEWRSVRRLVDVQAALGLTLSDAVALVDQYLHREPYSKQEVCDILAVTAEDLDATSLSERSRRGKPRRLVFIVAKKEIRSTTDILQRVEDFKVTFSRFSEHCCVVISCQTCISTRSSTFFLHALLFLQTSLKCDSTLFQLSGSNFTIGLRTSTRRPNGCWSSNQCANEPTLMHSLNSAHWCMTVTAAVVTCTSAAVRNWISSLSVQC